MNELKALALLADYGPWAIAAGAVWLLARLLISKGYGFEGSVKFGPKR
jgi:hypothetical protein